MKKLLSVLALSLSFSACASLPLGKPSLPQLLQYAQYGIEADCALGINQDICTFGTDALELAKGKSPVEVKKLLLDTEAKYPKVKPYVQFVLDSIG